ncbi:hypothetical protein EHF33_20520 (plasmid) [Deinococcus psychrotolerans]|uniref:Uncharacterized protein n=1 Tax=Deinococcus psychrotolerans TaxID=2489213 RepID=A0A3G8YVU2_9DEIO|nr:hypothetical protein [Deinococcus psychrotolerans]AZI45296.1 hypothetical protein EHF33_20520 [Deinococcus psychrotolerans]
MSDIETPTPLTYQEQSECLLKIAVANSRIEELQKQISEYAQERQQHEAVLIADATLTGQETEERYGYRVRLNKGRTSTSWDAAHLDKHLPEGIKALAISYTPRADSKVLNALADAGKLSEAALDARTVTPPQPRMVLEKVEK